MDFDKSGTLDNGAQYTKCRSGKVEILEDSVLVQFNVYTDQKHMDDNKPLATITKSFEFDDKNLQTALNEYLEIKLKQDPV